MTSVNTGLNPYAQYGSAYARAAATPSLANALNNDPADGTPPLGGSAATTLTLSEEARAKLADASKLPDFASVAATARTTLDQLYAAAKVKGPIVDGKTTISLSTLDRRALFAIATNNGGKFTPDEQAVASAELKTRFNAAMAPAAATTRLTGDYSVSYKAALDYLEAASPEEKATATWAAQHDAVLKGIKATQHAPTKAPGGIANDPVADYLAQKPGTGTSPARDFASVARDARALLDAQKAEAAKNHKDLVFSSGRRTGQLADLSSLDNRALSAITLNQGKQFSGEEMQAAKKELDARTRTSVLSALKQSQSSGDPRQLSLGILKSYSAMSTEERQATNWTPEFQDLALKNYKSTASLLSILHG
ncbi:hypothetical protein JQ557_08980 [Bradyrhizobium sp. U87765 SZCCT0131]|uniref:hypothetical protein n=1 Tax=unclassified Bradyrhizobium TaxID=2631580 RepID=UPI001BADC58C|nr:MULTISPECIES: hypothetical protein [unclassified Bradyrhizobium]MBR1218117.1 hypothetical protein [Bradyrhizobium sp. U87765 SZCCT0131]MBR1260937.1 hypothetical protein [Bradyrhizobium sp. U87765 SZCCT0134]MBR1303615.1 hypothetical protein [Bradyrhizobium sp. U87765 SZCCT0110]MBR1319221.1 hypothetical protein [Bradyrhizobium sp. U87765 SZCCT0109]MBR1347546.1 hypothetical protein [Bradyrhizobium sp. U87765 SZCCT0048]